MEHRTRLGPIAIFLTIVVMVITTLAILTVATSNADRIMAGRFAGVTQIRYELESDGQRFLSRAAEGADETTFEEEKDGYRIEVEISEPDEEGNFDVLKWKVSKIWNADDPVNDIWPGF